MKILLFIYFVLIALTVKTLATDVVIMDYDDVMYDGIEVYNYGCECECGEDW